MRVAPLFSALALVCLSTPVSAGEFKDHCANGLANYELLVETDCSIDWKNDKTGKTYCFSSEKSRAQFMQDAEGNVAKAEKNFAELDEN